MTPGLRYRKDAYAYGVPPLAYQSCHRVQRGTGSIQIVKQQDVLSSRLARIDFMSVLQKLVPLFRLPYALQRFRGPRERYALDDRKVDGGTDTPCQRNDGLQGTMPRRRHWHQNIQLRSMWLQERCRSINDVLHYVLVTPVFQLIKQLSQFRSLRIKYVVAGLVETDMQTAECMTIKCDTVKPVPIDVLRLDHIDPSELANDDPKHYLS